MPVDAEVDPRIDQIEPPQVFLRTYNADGALDKEIALKKYAPVSIGRSIGCLIDLVEPSISRRHCMIQYKDLIVDSFGNSETGFMIYDLKSSHGTFLNGERIPSMENIKLSHGDQIKLGLCAKIFTVWDMNYVEAANEQEQQSTASLQIPNSEFAVNENPLQQQPSSTSQTTENDATLDESELLSSEPWLQKYISILTQLADSAKEYEEYGVPVQNFDMESRLAKKLKLEHTKLVQQAQIVAELLALIGSEELLEEEEPVKRRKRRKEKDPNVEATPPKRGRKSKPNKNDDEENTPVKRRSRKTQKEQDEEAKELALTPRSPPGKLENKI